VCTVTQEKYQDREIKECYKENCTFDDTYLDNLPNSFDPAKKDGVIAQLISIYSWGNQDSVIRNMATNFVKLLVKYPSCVPQLGSGSGGQSACSADILDTILSYRNGISKYRCNVDPNDGCTQDPNFLCPNWQTTTITCCPGFKKRSQEMTRVDGEGVTVTGKAYCCDDGSQVVLG
jgi:hypothetical protein